MTKCKYKNGKNYCVLIKFCSAVEMLWPTKFILQM